MELWVIVIGVVTGLLSGAFGKGGSSVATPLLAAAGVRPFAALASPLPATIPATLAAAVAYYRQGQVDSRVLRVTVVAGVPATVIGALLSGLIGGGPLVLATDAIVAALGVKLLWPRIEPAPPEVATGPGHVRIITVAVLVGLASGLLANSGGFLLAPLFATALRMPVKCALGTSLAAAAALAVPGTITHMALGHVDWSVAFTLAVASVPLSVVGARLALRADGHRLQAVYGAVLVAGGLGLLALA